MNDIGNISDIALQVNQSSLLMIGLILLGTTFLIVLSQRLLQWLARKVPGRYRYHVLALVPIMRLMAITAAIILIIPQVIEPSFENLLALLAAFGLAVGFALRDYISSLVAGIVTLYEMPYRPGDWIEIEGEYGEVKSIGMRAARILTPDDTTVVIPHLKLWDRPILNGNSGSSNLMCVADFYLHPRHDANASPARPSLTWSSPARSCKIERRRRRHRARKSPGEPTTA